MSVRGRLRAFVERVVAVAGWGGGAATGVVESGARGGAATGAGGVAGAAMGADGGAPGAAGGAGADGGAPSVVAPAPRPPCAGLWDTPMVQVNGDVTTCCLDEGLVNRLGNVTETPLAAIWSSPTVHRWRVAQAEGRFADSGPLCTRCNWRSAGAVDEARVSAYLQEAEEGAALARYRRVHGVGGG